MAPTEQLRLPERPVAVNRHVLRHEIPALQLIAMDNGNARWGPLIRLPRGAELHELGEGFDDRTMLVRFENSFYIIFHQDLATSLQSSKNNGVARPRVV